MTVSERSASSLSEVQLITLLVLAGMTLGVVALTAALVLPGRSPDCGHIPCRRPMLTSSSQQQAQQEGGDCQISFKNAAEPEKKQLNTQVI